jgi:hypothetical protein
MTERYVLSILFQGVLTIPPFLPPSLPPFLQARSGHARGVPTMACLPLQDGACVEKGSEGGRKGRSKRKVA